MQLEELLNKMHSIFPELNDVHKRKSFRSFSRFDSYLPTKIKKNVDERRFTRDDFMYDDDDLHEKQKDAKRLSAETSLKSEINQTSSMLPSVLMLKHCCDPYKCKFDQDIGEKIKFFSEFNDIQK